MSAELATDKAWFPNERRPPFLDFRVVRRDGVACASGGGVAGPSVER